MKPTRLQLFFASKWPWRIWFMGIPVISLLVVGRICSTFLNPFSSWWELTQFAWFAFIALLLGFFLAMFPGWLIMGPIVYGRTLKNGGPFKVGDIVQILSGPYRGRVARVYSTWQGETFRVELGAEENEKLRDIFAGYEVIREESIEP